MFNIDKSLCTLHKNTLIVEASDAGLNFWPDFISVTAQMPDGSLEGFLFRRGSPDMNGDEVAGYRYFSQTGQGIELLVIND